jgi:hypothetical protein
MPSFFSTAATAGRAFIRAKCAAQFGGSGTFPRVAHSST